MTPEQNKHIEGIADYHSQLHNFGGAHPSYKDGLRNGFIAGAEYALANLSPGGWVRSSDKAPVCEPCCFAKIKTYVKDDFRSVVLTGSFEHNWYWAHGIGFKISISIDDIIFWYDETLTPSDKDKDLTTNELFKFYIKNEPVNFYLSNILRLPEEKQIQLKDALADRLPKDEKDKEIERLRDALGKIEAWELPATGEFWDEEKTKPVSYETNYGSNGARDYIRQVAREALNTKEVKDG